MVHGHPVSAIQWFTDTGRVRAIFASANQPRVAMRHAPSLRILRALERKAAEA